MRCFPTECNPNGTIKISGAPLMNYTLHTESTSDECVLSNTSASEYVLVDCNTTTDIVVWVAPGQFIKGGNSFWRYAISCGGMSNYTLNASMAVGPALVSPSTVLPKSQTVHLEMTIEHESTPVVIGEKIQLRIKDTNSNDVVIPQTCSAISTTDTQRTVEIWSDSSCSKRNDLIDSKWIVNTTSDISIQMYAFHFIGEHTLTVICGVNVCSRRTCKGLDATQCGLSNSRRRRRRDLSSGARKETKKLTATITIADLPYKSGTNGGGPNSWKAIILVLMASVAFR
ncbi:hypothetical protein ScPMuIL_003158 [Solemya velum]